MRAGSLFSGYDGLAMGVREVFGTETAWVCDNDPRAAAVLAYRYPDVPNLGDITAVDWTAVEPVDVLMAGWPCQPWSVAGKQRGRDDERALWPEVTRAVRVLRPRLFIGENVPGAVTAGELERAVCDLAAVGYVGSWVCVRASDVGAPHRRERLFIVAHPGSAGLEGSRPSRHGPELPESVGDLRTVADAGYDRCTGSPECDGWQDPGPYGELGHDADRHDHALADPISDAIRQQPVGQSESRSASVAGRDSAGSLADTARDGREQGRPESEGLERRSDAALGGDAPADPYSVVVLGGAGDGTATGGQPEPAVDWGIYGPAIRRWESVLGRPTPSPWQISERTGNRQLSARFTEWLMGLPDGWVTDVPGMTRNAALHVLGNGVVPAQAVYVLRLLLSRLDTAVA